MNFNNRNMPNIDKIVDNQWKANNYNYNGVKDNINKSKEQFNKMHNIKEKDEMRKERLYNNSVEGKVDRLNKSMEVLKMYNNNNNSFR